MGDSLSPEDLAAKYGGEVVSSTPAVPDGGTAFTAPPPDRAAMRRSLRDSIEDADPPWWKFSEARRQMGNVARGAAEQASAIGKVISGSPAGAVEGGEMLREMVAAPKRALMGEAEPGEPPDSGPKGLQRPADAVLRAIGADTVAARRYSDRGQNLSALEALVTAPAATWAAGKLVRVAAEHVPPRFGLPPMVSPTIAPPPTVPGYRAPGWLSSFLPTPKGGPAPLSSLPELRADLPTDVGGVQVGRKLRSALNAAQPGKYLPPRPERIQKLVDATGASDKIDVSGSLGAVLPELDETVRQTGVAPRGVSATEGTIDWPGEGVRANETLKSLYKGTMSRLEGNFEDVFKGIERDPVTGQPMPGGSKVGAKQVSGNSIADNIEKQIKPGVQELATQNPGSEADQFISKITETANLFRNKTFTLSQLDDLRHYFYETIRQSEAGRVALRSNESLISHKAAEVGIREVEYDYLQQQAQLQGRPLGFIRGLKDSQRHLYGLIDQAEPTSNYYVNQEAVKRGTNLAQRLNFTVAAHPESGTFVSSAHGVGQALAGKPRSMKSANQRVRMAFAQVGVPNTIAGKAAQGAANVAGRVSGPLGKAVVRGAIPDQRKQDEDPETAAGDLLGFPTQTAPPPTAGSTLGFTP